MNLKKLLLTKNECYKRDGKIIPKGIMVHSTGANNPNLKRYVGPDDGLLGSNANKNHWNQAYPDGKSVCVHAFIGKLANGSVATYQTLPWNHRGWHCGGYGNNTHIGFEICEDALTDAAYFNKVYQEAVELCAYLCRTYSLNPMVSGVLLCHSEGYAKGIASNHADVMHWFPKHGKSMDAFRVDVKAAMTQTATVTGNNAKPFLQAEKTMTPLRFVLEKMGGTVEYVNAKSPIRASYGGTEVEFLLSSKAITVKKNGVTTKKALDTAAMLKDGKTYIPLRAISESLGFYVYVAYDNATKTVIVCSKALSEVAKAALIAAGREYIR